MRQTINYICVLLLFMMGACTKDNNFSYDEAFDFQISDDIEEVIHIRQGDILRLSPDFDDSRGDYSYLWFAWRNNSAVGFRGERDTLGTEKNLVAEIKPTYYILGEPYRLTFKVTDNRTGVSAFYFYDLLISNIYTEGWLILEDRSGQVDFSMILPDGETVHEIYTSLNPNYPMTNPLQISLTRNNVADDVSATGRRLYLVSENDVIELDILTMQKRFDFNFLFFQAPAVAQPTLVGWSQPYSAAGSGVGIIVNEGLLSTNFVGGFPGAKKFGLYMQAPERAYDYEMAPFFASAVLGNQPYQHIMYDQRNKCFYQVSGQAISTFPTNASNTAVFDMNNVGLSLIHMDRSNMSNAHNAIMTDGSQAYLLQFTSATTTSDPVITRNKQPIAALQLGQANSATIASSTLSPHIFYGYGHVLSRYEINSDAFEPLYTFANGEDIVNTKFRVLPDGGGQLLVATWNGQEGKLYELSVSETGVLDTVDVSVKGGFSKVVDMVYKNAN